MENVETRVPLFILTLKKTPDFAPSNTLVCVCTRIQSLSAKHIQAALHISV